MSVSVNDKAGQGLFACLMAQNLMVLISLASKKVINSVTCIVAELMAITQIPQSPLLAKFLAVA